MTYQWWCQINPIQNFYGQTVQFFNHLAIKIQKDLYYAATAAAVANLALVLIVSKVTDKLCTRYPNRKYIPLILGNLTIIGCNLLFHAYVVTPLAVQAKVLITTASLVMYLWMQRHAFKRETVQILPPTQTPPVIPTRVEQPPPATTPTPPVQNSTPPVEQIRITVESPPPVRRIPRSSIPPDPNLLSALESRRSSIAPDTESDPIPGTPQTPATNLKPAVTVVQTPVMSTPANKTLRTNFNDALFTINLSPTRLNTVLRKYQRPKTPPEDTDDWD